jgi:hypothetical protein
VIFMAPLVFYLTANLIEAGTLEKHRW